MRKTRIEKFRLKNILKELLPEYTISSNSRYHDDSSYLVYEKFYHLTPIIYIDRYGTRTVFIKTTTKYENLSTELAIELEEYEYAVTLEIEV